MQRPVERHLKTATVKEFRYDLLWNLPDGIGERFDNSIHFSNDDAEDIVDAILDEMDRQKSPHGRTVFDVKIKGIIPAGIVGIMTYILMMCDDVRSFTILHPRGASCVIFPREYKRV